MSLKEGLIQAVVVLCVLAGFGYIILSQIVRKKPKVADFIKKLSPGRLYEKVPHVEDIPGKVEQVWDEKRTMM